MINEHQENTVIYNQNSKDTDRTIFQQLVIYQQLVITYLQLVIQCTNNAFKISSDKLYEINIAESSGLLHKLVYIIYNCPNFCI